MDYSLSAQTALSFQAAKDARDCAFEQGLHYSPEVLGHDTDHRYNQNQVRAFIATREHLAKFPNCYCAESSIADGEDFDGELSDISSVEDSFDSETLDSDTIEVEEDHPLFLDEDKSGLWIRRLQMAKVHLQARLTKKRNKLVKLNLADQTFALAKRWSSRSESPCSCLRRRYGQGLVHLQAALERRCAQAAGPSAKRADEQPLFAEEWRTLKERPSANGVSLGTPCLRGQAHLRAAALGQQVKT
ncbi:MAG: hypothetical protein M1814_004727 [Vezdaea aestivalis]|nr:MAG: hypothetical protein M1814_004727 [Vezdaea aestivalis]